MPRTWLHLKGKGDSLQQRVAFFTSSYDELGLDFTNNWWGTSDAQQIREWIRDGNDVPFETTRVIFEPFLTKPLASRKATFGSLKSRY